MTDRGHIELDGVAKFHGTVAALKGIDLEIRPGEFFALLGPSGSGKSTTLRLLAGLDKPTRGTIRVDGADVTALDAQDRDVAMVFQSYALYPHMTVGQNISFPLEMAKTPKDEADARVREAAQKVRIEHLLDRRPGQLSGGQQQRCALARAIVRKASLFLLDEPLSNLDAKLRLETRLELKRLQRSLGVTTVYVTHDQEEALTLADRMAVFMDGEIKQVGSPAEIFAKPNCVEVATFIGNPPMNLFTGTFSNEALIVGGVRLPVSVPGAPEAVTVGIRPSALSMSSTGIPATIEMIENLGDTAIADLRLDGGTARARIASADSVAEGQQVHLSVAAKDVHVFDPASGRRIEASAR